MSRATTDWPPLLILSGETGLLSTRLLFRKRGTGICNHFTSSILLINYSFFLSSPIFSVDLDHHLYQVPFHLDLVLTVYLRQRLRQPYFNQSFLTVHPLRVLQVESLTPIALILGVFKEWIRVFSLGKGWTVRNDWLKYGWRSLCRTWNKQLLHVL